MSIEKTELLPTQQLLDNLKGSSLFWFIKDTSHEFLMQIQHQRVNRTINLGTGESELRLLLEAETLGANPEGKLNEDTFLAIPMGEGRILFAVLDGASSQKKIIGLSQFGIRGAFYVSHLVALGFPNSSVHQELISRESFTATDVLKTVNTWLHGQMQKIEGVDYTDPLSVPGMAATFVLVDSKKGEATIAHVADTVACISYRDGSFEVPTPNLNEKFDQETLELAKKLVRERSCTLPEAMKTTNVREHLKDSFRRKINAPDGCGILNGMSALVKNSLIYETRIKITEDINSLFLFSDGALIPYSKDKNLIETITSFVNKYHNPHSGISVLEEGAQILADDPYSEKIPRTKSRDDSTFMRIVFCRK